MNNFIFQNPTKIIFGKKSQNQLINEIHPFGKRVMLLFGQSSAKSNGIYKEVLAQLKGLEINELWGIEPNPRVETIREALKQAREFKPDLLLAVGGGSVIDATKLLAVSYYSENDPWELVLDNSKISKALPLATVLTVAATGSEMDCYSVITNWNEHKKNSWESTLVYPKFSILNPEFTYSLSSLQTAYGIVDIYSHVLEQYMNTTKNALLQDRWAESIIKTLIEIGPKVIKDLDDYDLRANLMYCSTMALNGIISMGVAQDWATHNIEHELSAFYDIPHGAGLAVLTPHWLNEVKSQKRIKMAQYGRRVWDLKGEDNEVIIEAIAKTYEFFSDLGIAMQLNEYGINDKHFKEMGERLAPNKIGEIKLTKQQILNILNSSL
jgi:hypothetical protein